MCFWCLTPLTLGLPPDALGQALFFAMPMVLQDPWYAHLLRMQCTMYSVLAC